MLFSIRPYGIFKLMTDILRLSDTDLKVLGALYHEGRTPIEELALSIKIKAHVFRYSLQKLIDLDVISLQPFIDTYAFGISQCELYVKLATSDRSAVKKLEKHLLENQNVPWVGRYLGEYSHGFTFLTEHVNDIHTQSEKILDSFSSIIRGYRLNLRKQYIEYPLKIFGNTSKNDAEMRMGIREGTYKLAPTDHEILKEISAKPNSSIRDLGDKLNMHPSSIHQRMKNLEKVGVISGWAYYINFEKLGLLNYTFLVLLKNFSKNNLNNLRKFASQNPNVLYLSEGLGAWDLKISAIFYQPSESSEFLSIFNEKFENIISEVQVLTALDYLKVKRYPFQQHLT